MTPTNRGVIEVSCTHLTTIKRSHDTYNEPPQSYRKAEDMIETVRSRRKQLNTTQHNTVL